MSASVCVRCGAALSATPDAATLPGRRADSLAAQPAGVESTTAVGVASPFPRPDSTAGGLSATALGSTRMTLVPGAAFGPRYRIECLIGSGGMGAVYKAYDRELDRTVALKLIRPEYTADPAAMQRFKQEMLLASRVSHKNVLRIHDLGDVDGVKFISMAYVEGTDLHRVLRTEGRLPLSRAVPIVRQLCGALAAAHAEGVVHRDLKPPNILIDASGTAYISDFGLAKSIEASSGWMTRTGEILGTPLYMSPEQVEGKPADHRSDLYSLGLIFYEMVTGELPFADGPALQVMYQRVNRKPKDPRAILPELPDYVAQIILRCLERDPARRYQHAADIARDLETQRASSTRTIQITVPVPGRTGWLATAAVVALLLGSLLVPGVRHRLLPPVAPSAGPTAGIPPIAQGKYVAVLPFHILGNDASLNYVAEGLGEELFAKLFELRDVHVTSPGSSNKVDPDAPLEKVARDLGANLVIRGQLQGSGDKVRVILHVDDAAGGRAVWTHEFSGTRQDLLGLEDQIYSALVSELELNPSQYEQARAVARPTDNLQAYDLYLKGRAAMRGRQERRNVEAAIKLYEDALNLDNRFALAYAGLAEASLSMYWDTKDAFWAEKARGAAERAKALNDNLAEVHFALGTVYQETGDPAGAVVELRRALQLKPNSDEGYRLLGNALLADGRKNEAFESYQQAIKINPYYWLNYNSLGSAYFKIGDYETALQAFLKVKELEPDNLWAWENIGAAYFQQGKYAECIPYLQKAMQINPDAAVYSDLGTAYFFLKRYAEAVPMFEKAAELNPRNATMMGNLADAYRWSGQPEKAAAAYQKAIHLAYQELEVNPHNSAVLDTLALYHAKRGDSVAALRFIREARKIDPNSVEFVYDEAIVQALAGNPHEALKALREALQRGVSEQQAQADPELKSIQNLPEFSRLMKEFSSKAH